MFELQHSRVESKSYESDRGILVTKTEGQCRLENLVAGALGYVPLLVIGAGAPSH